MKLNIIAILILLFTTTNMHFAKKAGVKTNKYLFYASILLILLHVYLIIEKCTTK
jgi:hypothetical protein